MRSFSKTSYLLLLAVLLLLNFSCTTKQEQKQTKPNFLIILADDADFGFMGIIIMDLSIS
jgi:hypothetical protein